MGRPKALLPFGPETMLQRVVRLVGEAVRRVVVVAARGQELPELPAEVRIARDRRPDRGPLEGLAAGLRALRGDCEVAFLSGCDAPLLRPALVRRVLELCEGYQIAVPHVGGFDHPLCAAYRVTVLPHIETLLGADRLRPVSLFERVRARRVTRAELAEIDPQLDGLANVNHPGEHQSALARAGLLPR